MALKKEIISYKLSLEEFEDLKKVIKENSHIDRLTKIIVHNLYYTETIKFKEYYTINNDKKEELVICELFDENENRNLIIDRKYFLRISQEWFYNREAKGGFLHDRCIDMEYNNYMEISDMYVFQGDCEHFFYILKDDMKKILEEYSDNDSDGIVHISCDKTGFDVLGSSSNNINHWYKVTYSDNYLSNNISGCYHIKDKNVNDKNFYLYSGEKDEERLKRFIKEFRDWTIIIKANKSEKNLMIM